ncbi:tyrosine-type recombinase/integrase [Anaerorudis cellulosivorans]|jgi:site-specific recombinase XerD|uniref:tyrosine-type recombinase/integrase n=1 Tax=Anaerorudis cellulosivorans TaxID=3397862 RepID=UPI00221EBF66|nr:site-specific integrase [Seramator thermalis]MCW1735560.1 site-specific integrase [Seramator thermalis]
MKKNHNNNTKEVREIVSAYTSWLRIANSTKSPETVKTYETSINLYMKYIEEVKKINHLTFCPEKVFSTNTINDWLEYLNLKRGCSPQSCNVRLSALRAFLGYLGNNNIRYKSILYDAKNIEKRKTKKKKVKSMSLDAVKAIINTPDTGTPAGYRDSVLMSFLYVTACRIDEALSIKIGELKLTTRNPQVVIIGKGNKMRPLYITKRLADNLGKYIRKFFGDNPDNNEYLFFSKIKGKNEKITQEAIGKRLKQYALIANRTCADVPLSLHSHMFRHAAATHMLDNGMNIVQLSKILGHESVETTMQYLDISEQAIKKAMLSIVDDGIRNLPKKWKHDNGKLSEMFKQ